MLRIGCNDADLGALALAAYTAMEAARRTCQVLENLDT